MAVERFLAVCRPHHYRLQVWNRIEKTDDEFREVQADSGRILVYILPALLGAFIVNIPRFYDVLTVNTCEDFTHCGCHIVYRLIFV